MKSVLIVLLGVVSSSAAHAGVVYGTITVNNQPVTATKLTITCNYDYETTTDDQGSYSIRVGEDGKCVLRVSYQDQQPEAPVYSQQKPTRHDFKLERDADGNWSLKAQ